ncbi:glb-30 [Pristionchus pacificus]|uniref:Glb-30 n=1 Tax=Pristionchus pacificus TaxID=54126 RepID=A0A2A6B939_PRIPA|nr:glb-30 [Pristionchus pacificus]|eukprot:PDM62386.1 glb-30 [Pristionchus pacificus]
MADILNSRREMIESISTLTPKDKDILRNSWAIVSKDLETLATGIFEMIFEQAPDAKLMFPFMMKDQRTGGDKEKRSTEFTFHALRFIQVIESVMQCIDSPDGLEPLFRNLGQIHGRHQEQLGFRPHYWSVFKECTLYHFRKAMRGDKRRYCIRSSHKAKMTPSEIDSAIILWREVLRVMIERMNAGLEENNKIRKANREIIDHLDEEPNHHPTPRDAKHHIDTVNRRHELSVIVPDFFIRRASDEISLEGIDIASRRSS